MSYSVRVPKQGTYTVEATMNAGPLGGELKTSKQVEIK